MRRILLTGARAPATLHLARHLHAAGHQVLVADSVRFPVSRTSRTVRHFLPVPPPRQQPQDFITALRQYIRQHHIDWLIPTCEEIFYIARYGKDLWMETNVFCDDFERLDDLHNKWRFSKIAGAGEGRSPPTTLLQTPKDVRRTAEYCQNSIYKPVFSRFACQTLISPDIKTLSRIEPTPERPWVRQSRIYGTEYCTWSAARRGRVLAHACYKPIYRLRGGAGFYFQPATHPGIQHYVAELVRKQNFTGQIGFDVIEHANGQLFVIECNPRLTSGIFLFPIGCGLSTALLGEEREILLPPSAAPPPMLALAMLLFAGPQMVKTGYMQQAFRDFAQGRDVVWRVTDPLPLVGQFAGLAESALLALRHHQSLLSTVTRDIEWDGELPGMVQGNQE